MAESYVIGRVGCNFGGLLINCVGCGQCTHYVRFG